jgi:outer membrane immunogenic protein
MLSQVRRTVATLLLVSAAVAGITSPVAAQNWSGLYIGTSVGAAWGKLDWQYTTDMVPSDLLGLTRHPDGGIVGGHIGIQRQWDRTILGLEASYSAGAFGGIDERGSGAPVFDMIEPGISGRSYAQISNLFTVGPRLGWAPGNWMLYVTGGYARARVTTSDSLIEFGTEFQLTADKQTHGGWFLGGGVEYAMTPNWILGLEYTHVDLEEKIHSADTVLVRTVDPEVDIVRARLSFKFSPPERVSAALK